MSTVWVRGSIPSSGVVSWVYLEENDGVNGRPPACGIERRDQFADKGEVKRFVEMAVEMVGRHKLLEGDIDERGEFTVFATQHGRALLASRSAQMAY
jgi:hypothetical protein